MSEADPLSDWPLSKKPSGMNVVLTVAEPLTLNPLAGFEVMPTMLSPPIVPPDTVPFTIVAWSWMWALPLTVAVERTVA